MLTLSTPHPYHGCVTTPRAAKLPRKHPDRYHHGDLRRALLQAALRTIQKDGVHALTLRAVGDDLGVSRTAMYRHFSDKSALLAEVAREGFRMLRLALVEDWEREGKGTPGFAAMGLAYVRFALANPSHYRVMFGSALSRRTPTPELAQEGAAAFQVLVDAIVEQQQGGLIRADDPLQLARYIWAIVHGLAMLAIDGQLPPEHGDIDTLTRFSLERLRTGVAGSQ